MRPSSAQRCSVREHLAGVEQPGRIEGAFHPLLLLEVGLGEHHRHQVALLDADAVLAGQHAADFDAEAQDVGAEGLGAFEFARLVGVVEDQRVQIAVAGMEDVGDAQAVLVDSSSIRCQHVRAAAARDGAVHAVVVGRDAAHRGEGGLAAGPDGEALGLGCGGAERTRRSPSRWRRRSSIRWSHSAAGPSSSTIRRASTSSG